MRQAYLGQWVRITSLFLVIGLVFSVALTGAVQAQSGTKISPRGSNSTNSSSMKMDGKATSKVAMEGYCPVCIIEMKKWVRGTKDHTANYDGMTYHFPGAKQKEMFQKDPAKYVPALGGDCTVCFAEMKKCSPGNIRYTALHEGRLFLFPEAKTKEMFLKNPAKYANVDLAMNGQCSVCKVEAGKSVAGKKEIAAVHKGKRYLFPSEMQRKMFLANPDKYAEKESGTKKVSSTRKAKAKMQLVSVKGITGCAACEHGVTPIASPNELGLVVTAADGNIYVLEEAHSAYPKVYGKRFDRLNVKVTGEVLKKNGKFIWLNVNKLIVVK